MRTDLAALRKDFLKFHSACVPPSKQPVQFLHELRRAATTPVAVTLTQPCQSRQVRVSINTYKPARHLVAPAYFSERRLSMIRAAVSIPVSKALARTMRFSASVLPSAAIADSTRGRATAITSRTPPAT